MYGIDFNISKQLELLRTFTYSDELRQISRTKNENILEYSHDNPSFSVGDAEILYSMMRMIKPKKIIEVGSGYSTLLIEQALKQNRQEGAESQHICIEPYEMPWLELLGVDRVLRERVENIDMAIFKDLNANDILFIDSSHVVRTGGDVLYLYLSILPNINPGVIIHCHDIFFPYEYPRDWIVNKRRFWTEQYILQAFLTFNDEFEIMLAMNDISINHASDLATVCPVFAELGGQCGSLWLRRKVKCNGISSECL